jgi:peptidoglycan/xylan/chitin deacetylase (PgdA/CDA1 family)
MAMKRFFLILAPVSLLALAVSLLIYTWNSHLTWRDIATFNAQPFAIGTLKGEPLERLGLKRIDLTEPTPGALVSYLGKSRYVNDARAVVVHTIDDSTPYIINCLDALDKCSIKATVFVSTERNVISQLWPRLRRATANGHEIGSHSRRHQCQWPDTRLFCFRAYTDYEISGSREDILKNTNQPYVWSWCYPCGNCANYEFVQRKLARAGYLIARNYPGEAQDMHNLPNLQGYDSNPYNATYTQVVQKKGGIAKSGRTNVPEINAKFDEVYQRGGIYNFLSHPQWLDYGVDQFYQQHLAHIGRRADIWYVPMGPLYAYRTVLDKTEVRALEPKGLTDRFAVYNDLDPKMFTNSITLEFSFRNTTQVHIQAGGKPLPEKTKGLTDRWDAEYFRREGKRAWVTIHPNKILEFRFSVQNREIE